MPSRKARNVPQKKKLKRNIAFQILTSNIFTGRKGKKLPKCVYNVEKETLR